ncbi:UNKNOWN [Stylonychia lemnae]|uniref:Uncharacterized protein n=1 Tax=Stylonychia lemnae TaxID=5949 RepID=A0A078A533_STYLE|nr:UNKNOWN [Stylonychia lemnae]|eukprot:CDW76979.1 UNKNOWN [Stylonychia lemnae]
MPYFRRLDPSGYYIDNQSKNSGYELGIKNYPFKQLDDAFREIFNYATDQTYNITLKIKGNSSLNLFSDAMPILLINHNYTIITQDNVIGEIFNPTLLKNGTPMPYHVKLLQKSGKVPYDYESKFKLKFYLYDADLTIIKLRFIEHTVYTVNRNALFTMYQSLKWINISDCDFKIKQGMFYSKDGWLINVKNSMIDYTNMFFTQLMDLDPNIQDCKYQTNEYKPYIYIYENNTFYGIGIIEYGLVWNIQTQFKLFMFKNNRFKSFLQNRFGATFYVIFGNECPRDNGLREIVVEDNTFDFSSQQIYNGVIFYWLATQTYDQDTRIAISNNLFTNLGYGLDEINFMEIIDESLKSFRVEMTNNTFDGIQNNRDYALSRIIASKIRLDNITIKNSEIGQGFQIISGDSKISNIVFHNITSRFDLNIFKITKQLSASNIETIQFNNLTFQDSNISLILFQSINIAKEDQSEFFNISLRNIDLQKLYIQGKYSLIRFQSIAHPNFKVIVRNLQVLNNIIEQSSIFELQHNSKNLSFIDCSFINNTGQIFYINPTLQDKTLPQVTIIRNSQFVGNNGKDSSLFYSTFNSNLTFYNTLLENNYAIGRGSLIFSENNLAFVEISSSVILNNYGNVGLLYSNFYSTFIITNTTFKNNFAIVGGIMYAQNEGRGLFSNCSFQQNKAFKASLIYSINSQSIISIKGGLLENNLVGALSTFKTLMFKFEILVQHRLNKGLAKQTSLRVNSNLQGLSGAAIYIVKQSKSIPSIQLTVVNSSFYYISANLDGGAIYSLDTNVAFLNNSFTNGTSGESGGLIYLKCSTSLDCDYLIFNNTLINSTARLKGGAIYYDSNRPQNINDNIFLNNSAIYGPDIASFPFQLKLINSRVDFLKNITSEEYLPDNFYIGLVDQDDQIVNDKISSTLLITSMNESLSVTGITSVISEDGVFEISELKLIGKPSKSYQLKLSSNAIDQTQINYQSMNLSADLILDIKFRECVQGEIQYERKCFECPRGTYSLSVPDKNCRNCPDYAKCDGGTKIFINYNHWRSNTNTTKIYKCPKNDVCLSLIKNSKRNNPQTLLMRILTNYFQVVMMVKEFQLNWPTQITEFLDYISIGGQGYSQVMSFECLINESGVDIGLHQIYFFVILVGLMPIIMSLIAYAIWTVAYQIKKINLSHKQYRRYIRTSIILFSYLCYPIISQNSFSLLSCVEFEDGISYLRQDMNIECWTEEHKRMALTIALPFILLWAVMFPSLIAFQLWRNREGLSRPKMMTEYGLFYTGLKDENYYWEVTYAMIGLGLIFMELQISHLQSPYMDPHMNLIDRLSSYASISILIGGMFYISDEFKNKDSAMTTLFVIILILNMIFGFFWLYTFLKIIITNKIRQLQGKINFLKRISIVTYQERWSIQQEEIDRIKQMQLEFKKQVPQLEVKTKKKLKKKQKKVIVVNKRDKSKGIGRDKDKTKEESKDQSNYYIQSSEMNAIQESDRQPLRRQDNIISLRFKPKNKHRNRNRNKLDESDTSKMSLFTKNQNSISYIHNQTDLNDLSQLQ